MKTPKLVQPGSKKLRLVQYLIKNGVRVFRRAELEEKVTKELQLKSNYQTFGVLLHDLYREGWVKQVRRGIYVVANTATPIYEQEIAMALVKPAMISYGSAFHHHGLTDQIPGRLQITTINSVIVPKKGQSDRVSSVKINGITYEFIRVHQNKFFGAEDAWVGEGNFQVTDLERTLLDGLSRPHYCGGFQEVIHAYKESFKKINLDKIIDYALRLDVAVSRRLGWILKNILDVKSNKTDSLVQKKKAGYRLLDSSRADTGPYDHEWQLRLNHHANW